VARALKVRLGPKPEAPDLKRELPLSADCGRSDAGGERVKATQTRRSIFMTGAALCLSRIGRCPYLRLITWYPHPRIVLFDDQPAVSNLQQHLTEAGFCAVLLPSRSTNVSSRNSLRMATVPLL
jgi:hypothetical protein